jgi:hypothetical protein
LTTMSTTRRTRMSPTAANQPQRGTLICGKGAERPQGCRGQPRSRPPTSRAEDTSNAPTRLLPPTRRPSGCTPTSRSATLTLGQGYRPHGVRRRHGDRRGHGWWEIDREPTWVYAPQRSVTRGSRIRCRDELVWIVDVGEIGGRRDAHRRSRSVGVRS